MSAPAYPPAVLAALPVLDALLEHYVQLINSGDAGFWNPEEEPVVIDARRVLAAWHASRDAAMHAADSEALDAARLPQPHRFGGPL